MQQRDQTNITFEKFVEIAQSVGLCKSEKKEVYNNMSNRVPVNKFLVSKSNFNVKNRRSNLSHKSTDQ